MLYQYHCACCEKVVESGDRSCSSCGSQNIRTPYGFWLFSIFACLMVAIILKASHVYIQDKQEVPKQQNILDTISQSISTNK